MKKIFLALLMLSIFANIPSLVFSWSGTPSSSVNLANSSGATVTPKQNLAKGESGGGGSVPVGTIIAWPVATNPSDADKWLECKGQTITAAAYPELYAVVGSRVPDYQGMFLRGYGSQSSSHYNYVTHSSGNLNTLQGDAIRNIYGTSWGIDATAEFRNDSNIVWTGAFRLGSETYALGVAACDRNNGRAHFNASNVVPTAVENRPVNKAVRYLIRAKS